MRLGAIALLVSACVEPGGFTPPGEGDAGPLATSDAGPAAVPDAAPPPAGDGAPPPAPLPDIAFDRYHSQDEIAAYLRAVAAARPAWVRFEVLGASAEGREIAYVVVDATGDAAAPAVYLNGTHHGDEKSSTEAMLGVIDHVLANAGAADVAPVLGAYAIVVQPLVNPDGHAWDTREVANGADPNRDYAYPERSEAQSFDLVETRLVKQLQDAHQFHAAAAYHSGITEVIWPWAYTSEATGDHDLFHTLAQAFAEEMGFDRYLQSYFDYPTEGEYIDYAYWKHGTLAVTVEVSSDKSPPEDELAFVVDRAVRGTLVFMNALAARDHAALPLVRESEPHRGSVGPRVEGGRKLE